MLLSGLPLTGIDSRGAVEEYPHPIVDMLGMLVKSQRYVPAGVADVSDTCHLGWLVSIRIRRWCIRLVDISDRRYRNWLLFFYLRWETPSVKPKL